MTAGLSRNTETLSEHRQRLEAQGLRPLPPHVERAIFPAPASEADRIPTEAEYDGILSGWHRRVYHRRAGAHDPKADFSIRFGRWDIRVKPSAYSPIRRLKALVRSLKRRGK